MSLLDGSLEKRYCSRLYYESNQLIGDYGCRLRNKSTLNASQSMLSLSAKDHFLHSVVVYSPSLTSSRYSREVTSPERLRPFAWYASSERNAQIIFRLDGQAEATSQIGYVETLLDGVFNRGVDVPFPGVFYAVDKVDHFLNIFDPPASNVKINRGYYGRLLAQGHWSYCEGGVLFRGRQLVGEGHLLPLSPAERYKLGVETVESFFSPLSEQEQYLNFAALLYLSPTQRFWTTKEVWQRAKLALPSLADLSLEDRVKMDYVAACSSQQTAVCERSSASMESRDFFI